MSSRQPGGPESKCIGIEFPYFDITKEDLVKVFAYTLTAEFFEAEHLADEHYALVPDDVAVHLASQSNSPLLPSEDVEVTIQRHAFDKSAHPFLLS
jgi:hypothetical protein